MTLKQIIIERIKSQCPISFETFMEMCLYYPQLGYYTNNSTKIGRAGDFYTSPHLHPIFGAMIGNQIEEMWNLMGKPDLFHVVEMGAGMGYLAKDVLGYLHRSAVSSQQSGKEKEVFRHLKYTIVELNPSVKARQQELLSEFIDKVNWVSDLKDMEPIAGCFLSNELLDAFPVRAVEMSDELMEIYVDVKGDELTEVTVPCGKDTKEFFKEFSVELPEGFRTEVNLRIKDWLRGVSEKLSEGFVLTVDYGYPAWDYYSEERSRGTLLCYHGHQVNENPYQNVGEQDMTAHVNFSALKKWGEEAGIKTIGFCPQGTYLVSLGIDEVIPELYGDSPDAFEIAKIKGLILTEGMGESHKVMVQYKGSGDPELRGFSLRNQVGKL
jgi:SAM-dependent MidA family methyltransferase